VLHSLALQRLKSLRAEGLGFDRIAGSIRACKMLLLALNEALDKRQVELLLMLDKVKALWICSDSVVNFAGLLASGMV